MDRPPEHAVYACRGQSVYKTIVVKKEKIRNTNKNKEERVQLPSDSTSRWTPLLFSYILPTVGRIRDFHPLETCAARRTLKKKTVDVIPWFSFLNRFLKYF